MSTASNLSAPGSAHELGTTRYLPLWALTAGVTSMTVTELSWSAMRTLYFQHIVDAIECHPRPFQSLFVVWYLSLADSVECPQNARGPNPQMHSIQMYVLHNGCKVRFVHIKTFVVGKSWVTTMASCRPT